MAPRVAAIYTAERTGEPVVSREAVELIAGVGIAGDRYATGQGYWSDPRWPAQELTLVEAETADDMGIDAGLLRRNIVTRGVRLDDLLGATFRIGEATLQGVRPCDPCAHIESLTGPGMLAALRGRGGLRARILVGGRVAVGDEIMVESPATRVLPDRP